MPADIVGKIGPVLSAKVKRVLFLVAVTVRVRSWLSTPMDCEGGGTLYFGLEEERLPVFGNGREGGMIDDANDDEVDDVDVDEDVEVDAFDGGGVEESVVLVVDGESSLTLEDEAKDDASCIWGITEGRASCLPTSDRDSDSVGRVIDVIVLV